MSNTKSSAYGVEDESEFSFANAHGEVTPDRDKKRIAQTRRFSRKHGSRSPPSQAEFMKALSNINKKDNVKGGRKKRMTKRKRKTMSKRKYKKSKTKYTRKKRRVRY